MDYALFYLWGVIMNILKKSVAVCLVTTITIATSLTTSANTESVKKKIDIIMGYSYDSMFTLNDAINTDYFINRYNGVIKIFKNNMPFYQSKIHVNGDYLIGTYETENEAAIAYNKAIDILKKAGCNKNYTPNFLDIPSSQYAVIYNAIPISEKVYALTFPYNQ